MAATRSSPFGTRTERNVFNMEQVDDSETSEERHRGLHVSRDSSSNNEIPLASDSFIHVLNKLARNGDLCPLAFCSYTDPTGEQGWTEYTNNGCRVQYLDEAFLNSSIKGVLKITLNNAQNVVKSDVFSESDPYIIFSAQESRVASEIKHDDPNPEWNSTLFLLIKNDFSLGGAESELVVKLFDSDSDKYKPEEREARQVLRKDDPLGSASMNLSKALIPEKQDWNQTLKLDKTEGQSTQDTVVSFSTEFISLEQALEKRPKRMEKFDFCVQQDPNLREKSPCAFWNMTINSSENQGLKPVAFVNGVKTGTQAWIFLHETVKTVTVVFRGTEKTRVKDLLTVFQFSSSELSLTNIELGNLELNTAAQDENIRVHKGFKDAYYSIRKTIWQLVYAITGWSEDWKVCTTGHSLGGALAAICALDFANTRDKRGTRPKVFMMSFGSPRIGNKAFKDLYQKTVGGSCRVAIGRDIICGLPPQLKHAGSELRFEKGGEVRWRSKPIKEIEVDVPDEPNVNIDRWTRCLKSATTVIRCHKSIESWVGKSKAVDLPRLRRAYSCLESGRRFYSWYVASRKPRSARCFTRLVSRRVSLKQIQKEDEKSEKKAFSLFQYLIDHTAKSYRRFLRIYTNGDPNELDYLAWSVQNHSSQGFREVYESMQEFIRRPPNEEHSSHCAQQKNNGS